MIIRLFVGASAAVLLAAVPRLATLGSPHETRIVSLARVPGTGFTTVPPEPWGQAGPADSLYRLGREAINRGDFRRAVALFAEISARYPRSEYGPDALYWRAWNRYQTKEYDTAWEDVENAIKGLSNARVYMLAGLIAYSRKTLQIAVDRFDTAFAADASACDAVWMSGLVSIDNTMIAMIDLPALLAMQAEDSIAASASVIHRN